MVGLAAIAAIGYLIIKKLEPVGQAATAATNTVSTYVEKVTEKYNQVSDRVEHVTNNASIVANTFDRYFTPSGIAEGLGEKAAAKNDLSLTSGEKNQAQTVVDNANKVNDYALATTPATQAGVNVAMDYIQGLINGSKTNDNKYTAGTGTEKASTPGLISIPVSPAIVPVTSLPSPFTVDMGLKKPAPLPAVQPTPAAITKAVQEYNIITGEKKTGSSSSSKPATVSTSAPSKVSALKGGYSVAKSSGTTKDAGKYSTIKVKK